MGSLSSRTSVPLTSHPSGIGKVLTYCPIILSSLSLRDHHAGSRRTSLGECVAIKLVSTSFPTASFFNIRRLMPSGLSSHLTILSLCPSLTSILTCPSSARAFIGACLTMNITVVPQWLRDNILFLRQVLFYFKSPVRVEAFLFIYLAHLQVEDRELAVEQQREIGAMVRVAQVVVGLAPHLPAVRPTDARRKASYTTARC
eukprot:scaffold22740_cov66-Phaeocystis_antarctica.AAC.3